MRNALLRAAFLCLALIGCQHSAPVIAPNQYGLPVVRSMGLYRATVRADHDKKLIDLARSIPQIRLDLRYATPDNFMHKRLYPVARAFVRLPAERALEAVEKELAALGLGLKVFDAYRPYRVTEMMWEPIRNPDYVADPAKGSRHNRGCAVDLTLIRLSSGEELEMGTPFDSFAPAAGHAWTDLPAAVLENRRLLRRVMEAHGFRALESEWWHYDLVGYERFELLDLPLEAL